MKPPDGMRMTSEPVRAVATSPLAKMSCLPTLAAMRLFPLLAAFLLLAGCDIDQTQPAAVQKDDRWGHLPPDPERPQQADLSAVDDTAPAA
jgi:hypothetical protein